MRFRNILNMELRDLIYRKYRVIVMESVEEGREMAIPFLDFSFLFFFDLMLISWQHPVFSLDRESLGP